MSGKKIGVVGIGKMGSAILEGLKNKEYELFAKGRGKTCPAGVTELLTLPEILLCDIVVICVKPKDLGSLCSELRKAAETAKKHPIFISIAAGKTISFIQRILGEEKIVRAMPNLAAKVGRAVTCYSPNDLFDKEDKKVVEELFNSLGACKEVDEKLLDAVTALSGSGPAYFFLFCQKMAEAGRSMELDEETANLLARETFFGSAHLAESTKLSFEELVAQIATPGGTTEAALKTLDEGRFGQNLIEALKKAKFRSSEVGKA